MYELIQISEHDYYIDCPSKIGLVRISEDEVVAIDSGNDKDAGKKVLRHLEANKWKLKAIINTHSHADHIGGNKFLQDRTGCKIYASGMECDFTNHPLLEPMNLYGGYPFADLKHKFLMAQPSIAEPLTQEVLPKGMKIIPLPGHSFDMIGILTADGTAYLADCVSSAVTLEKYGIGYLWDVESYLNTLEQIKQLPARHYVPAHAPASDEIASLADINRKSVEQVSKKILSFCAEPKTFEQILKQVFEAYNLTMNAQQYALIGSTVRSYLAWMKNQGFVQFTFEENQMMWTRT